jgi:hypothetical protein
LDGLRFGMGDAVIGEFTWNQISGLIAGIGGVLMIWWLDRTQEFVTAETDRELIGAEA